LDDCVLMKDDNGKLSWADIHCDNTTTTEADGSTELEIEVLCQCVGEECTPPTPEPTLEPTTIAPTCDAGWIVNQGLGCIKPLAEGADTTTLAKAAEECAKVLGGTSDGVLVEPQDACKEAALIDFLKYPLSKDVWWIGLTYDTSSTKKNGNGPAQQPMMKPKQIGDQERDSSQNSWTVPELRKEMELSNGTTDPVHLLLPTHSKEGPYV